MDSLRFSRDTRQLYTYIYMYKIVSSMKRDRHMWENGANDKMELILRES